jgi:hypothetical protein
VTFLDLLQEGETDEEGGYLCPAQRRPPMEEVWREEDQQLQLPQVRNHFVSCRPHLLICICIGSEKQLL